MQLSKYFPVQFENYVRRRLSLSERPARTGSCTMRGRRARPRLLSTCNVTSAWTLPLTALSLRWNEGFDFWKCMFLLVFFPVEKLCAWVFGKNNNIAFVLMALWIFCNKLTFLLTNLIWLYWFCSGVHGKLF